MNMVTGEHGEGGLQGGVGLWLQGNTRAPASPGFPVARPTLPSVGQQLGLLLLPLNKKFCQKPEFPAQGDWNDGGNQGQRKPRVLPPLLTVV